MSNDDKPVPPEENPPALQQGYSPNVVISGSQNVVTVGHQQGAVAQHTWPQKLASHSLWYWIVHFLIGVLAAGLVTWAVWYFFGIGGSH